MSMDVLRLNNEIKVMAKSLKTNALNKEVIQALEDICSRLRRFIRSRSYSNRRAIEHLLQGRHYEFQNLEAKDSEAFAVKGEVFSLIERAQSL